MPALTSFLNEDENMVWFSFVLNNTALPLVDDDEPDLLSLAKKKKKGKKQLVYSVATEKEVQENGLTSDYVLVEILDAATLHPKLEVIKIAQCMQDHLEALEWQNYKAE